ncbi:adenosine receptor A3-like [Physella acuta]|uniref:adenosine receptor A3-like n=1 Tax=Physella acuta TaxID=109671 RepID=UPI0027DDA412|nr:adenosine receptor A3-like [Physella acuta]
MNSSINSSAISTTETYVTELDVVIFSLAMMLSFFICTVNILTILVIWRTPQLRTFANVYVTSLALADFLIGLELAFTSFFFLPSTRVDIFYKHIRACLMMNGFNIGMTGVSIIHMAIVAVDRYIYITKPYFYERAITKRVVVFFILLAWIVGLTYSILPQFYHNNYGEIPVCHVTEIFPIWHLFYGSWSLYFITSTVILIMYLLILRAAVKQRKAIHAFGPTGIPSNSQINNGFSRHAMKTLKFFFTVFGAFFVCLTPCVVVLGVDFYVTVPAMLYRVLSVLAFTNSGMNFIIFTAQNRCFRHALLKMLRCPVKQRHNPFDIECTFTTNQAHRSSR